MRLGYPRIYVIQVMQEGGKHSSVVLLLVLATPAYCVSIVIGKITLKTTITQVHPRLVCKIQILERGKFQAVEPCERRKVRAGPVGFEFVGVSGASHDMLVTPKAS